MRNRQFLLITCLLVKSVFSESGDSGAIVGAILGGLFSFCCTICIAVVCFAVIAAIVLGAISVGILAFKVLMNMNIKKEKKERPESLEDFLERALDEDELNTKIYEAIKDGNLEDLKPLLDGFDLKSQKVTCKHEEEDFRGRYPGHYFQWIHYAVIYNHLEIVKYLIEDLGVDVNEPTFEMVYGEEEYGEEEEEEDSDPENNLKENETSLHIAAREGHVSIVQYLLQVEGIDKEAVDRRGDRPYGCARTREIQELIQPKPMNENEILVGDDYSTGIDVPLEVADESTDDDEDDGGVELGTNVENNEDLDT